MSKKSARILIKNIWKRVGGVSVRSKVFGLVLGSTLMMSLVFVYQIRITLYDVLEQKSQEEGISVARDVAARATDMILTNDLFSLHKLLRETRENYPDVRYAFILDTDNYVLSHTFDGGFPVELIEANAVNSETYQHTIIIDAGDEKIWDIAVPIFDGETGTARVGISDAGIRRIMRTLTAQLGLTIAVVLGASLLAATLLTWVMTRPILILAEAAKKISNGDFTPRVERWANDEIGDLAESFNQMTIELARTDEIRREREQLRQQLLGSVISAQEEERRRISRELHDSTSQSLTSLIVGLRTLETLPDLIEVSTQAHQLRGIARQILNEIHNLAVQLRPTVLDDMGLLSALQLYASEYQGRYGIKIEIQAIGLKGNKRLTSALETTVYRVAQEALTNVAKYSQAHQVSILLEQREQIFSLIVEDDGQGFDFPATMRDASRKQQLGLYGMRERAEQLGGRLLIESNSEQGTTVYLRVPLLEELK